MDTIIACMYIHEPRKYEDIIFFDLTVQFYQNLVKTVLFVEQFNILVFCTR